MKRWIAFGAALGLVISLGFTLAMPTKYVRTTDIPTRAGRPVPVYGALAPFAPRRLTVPTEQRSPRTERDLLLGLIAGGMVAGAIVLIGGPSLRRTRF